HLYVEGLDLIGEVVVGPNCRHGNQQTKCSGDQGFRDTAGYCRQTSRLAALDTFKRIQNSDHRAEQSHEWRRGSDRRESGEAALHFRVHDSDGALKPPLGGFDYVSVGYLLRSGLKLGESSCHNLGDMALLVSFRDRDRFIQLAFLQRPGNLLNEHTRLLACRAVHQRAVDHHTERINGENKQNTYDNPGQGAHRGPHTLQAPRASGGGLQEYGRMYVQSGYHSYAP